MNRYMEKARKEAFKGIRRGEGGPFGAVIVKDNKIIATGNNKVLCSNDPTAHAEIVAIRRASLNLNTYDLSDCVLYTSAYPCPMCLSAIIWANIKEVYYGCTKEDTDKIGFRDDFIYKVLKGDVNNLLDLKLLDRTDCLEVFKEYQDNKGVIY